MSTLIILGDVHLGKGTSLSKFQSGILNSRISDQLNLLNWTLDKALHHNSNNIFITGDIFEEPKPNHSLITLFISWLKQCQINSVNVHIVLGNHDILRTGNNVSSALDIIIEAELPNVIVYKDIDTVTFGTTAITLIPFKDRKSLNCSTNAEAISTLNDILTYELSSIPFTYNKIVIGHLAIEGSLFVGDEVDDISTELFCPLDMFAGYDYTWMGHVHKPQIMKRSPLIAHIGSMDISNFGETDHIKHIVVYDCILNKYIIEVIPTRQLKHIFIIVPKDVDSTEYVLNELKYLSIDKSIVKLDIEVPKENLSLNKSLVEQNLLANGVYSIAGIVESRKVSIVKKDKDVHVKMDIESAIKKFAELNVDKELQSEFIDLGISIYNQYKTEVKD
jgi:DNA repair exonuclease SbcCD nuclease subunit